MSDRGPNLIQRCVERDRNKVRRYLDAMGAGKPVAERRSYVVSSTGNKHRASGWAYPCGCFVPLGYPLYRGVEACGRHARALP
jgi:hypothetical protein